MIHFITTRARALGMTVAGESALPVMLSRWENGRVEVTDPGYRRLFREFYGRTNEELGFPPEPQNESAEELRDRLTVARSIDSETLDLFQRQVNDLRASDQHFGAIVVLDQLNNLVRQMESVRAFSVRPQHRERLAAILTDARTLAGWTALDRGSQLQAWQYHEDAKVSAREADSPYLLAHAVAQQAVILLDIGEPAAAVELIEYARHIAENRAPSLLRSWLAAAHGEGLAATGNRSASLRTFDEARLLLPSHPIDPELPFLLMNDGHLARWRGSALLRLESHDTIKNLTAAAHELDSSPRGAIRGQLSMYVDLAFAYAAAGSRTEALDYVRKAKQLASRIGSDRQQRRLAKFELADPEVPRVM
ncbi:tetratricopeptide repeat protein [Actinosynnema sp. NPDC020468]|uniref:tetratricopeptide repeat protein n=1 Tax=Actinosynnema sp. NPDC020468 TaxID=3154488 RepID=UPI0033E5851C